MPKEIFSIEGILVSPENEKRGRIEIDRESGFIVRVCEPTGIADKVFKDELIFPGFVDLHVHARECADHSQDYKEDFTTASAAAINGGVVAFAEMPNNPVPPTDEQSYAVKKMLTKKSPIEVVLYAGVGTDTTPLGENVPYKVFMGPSIGNLFFRSEEELENVLRGYKGCSVSFHCEDPEILEKNKEQPTHEMRRPKEAEAGAVGFALRMIKKYNLQGKICHSSTREGIEKIKKAKSNKVNVVAEVSPHHLYFDSGMLTDENRNWMRMNPPLRSPEDRAYLLEALREGTIDFIATDHAPHTAEEKIKGISGTPQLDTYGPFTTWLMKECKFKPETVARVCSYNPGNFINQFSVGRYGQIAPGWSGSLTVLDMDKPITITKEVLKTKCGWSAFEGVTFPGRVVMTIVKGQIYLPRTKIQQTSNDQI